MKDPKRKQLELLVIEQTRLFSSSDATEQDRIDIFKEICKEQKRLKKEE